MYVLDIPSEVLLNTFKFLPRKSLLESRRVCSSWHPLASSLIFHKISLSPNHTNSLRKFKENLRHFQFVQYNVQTLEISSPDGCYCMLEQEEFNDLVAALPCLKNIHFRVCDLDNLSTYLKYLIDIPKSFLQDINRFSVGWVRLPLKYMEHYINLNIQYRESIIALAITDWKREQDLPELLSKFEKLKSLTFLWDDFHREHDKLYSLQSMLTSSKTVEHIDVQRTIEADDFNSVNKPISSGNLKSVKFFTTSLDQEFIEFIVYNLPKIMRLELVLVYSWSTDLLTEDIDYIHDFTTYLKRLDFFKITHRDSFSSGGSIIHLSSFWKFLHTIWEDSLLCDLNLWFNEYFRGGYLTIDKRSKIIKINESWNDLPENWFEHLNFMKFKRIIIRSKTIQSYSTVDILESIRKLINERKSTLHQIYIRNQAKHILNIRPTCLSEWTFINDCVEDLGNRPLVYLKMLKLDKKLLNIIGSLYPKIENVNFERCKIQKEQHQLHTNTYDVDLTSFQNIHQFTFDFDYLLRRKIPPQYVYIQIISPENYDLYCYNHQNVLEIAYLGQKVYKENCKKAYLVRVHCNRIGQIIFKAQKNQITLKSVTASD